MQGERVENAVRAGRVAGTAHLLAAVIAFGLGAFAVLDLHGAVSGASANASIVAAVIVLLLGLVESKNAVRFYAGRGGVRDSQGAFDDGGVPGGVLLILVPSGLVLWHSFAVGGTVNELVVWVVGLIGLFVFVVLAKILSDKALHRRRDQEPSMVTRVLVIGAIGALLFLAAGGAMSLMAVVVDNPPRCDGQNMTPRDVCIVYGGSGGGTYEEMRQRGEEDSGHLRKGASIGFTAAGVLFVVVTLSTGAVVLARMIRKGSTRSSPRQ